MAGNVTFRFYEELNDFIKKKNRKTAFQYRFTTRQTVKDAIEANGVPHTEVDLILVNSEPVSFTYKLNQGDYVSVYPVFESFDISGVTGIQHSPLREIKFVADVHLGRLARYLRMLGMDTLYKNDFEDAEIIEISNREKRTILTHDKGILMNGKVSRGYFVRNENPKKQLTELVKRFHLVSLAKPFSRCLDCNGKIIAKEKQYIDQQLEPLTKKYFNKFLVCENCGKIYWKGSHYEKMIQFISNIFHEESI